MKTARTSRRMKRAPLTGVVLAGGNKRIDGQHPGLLVFQREIMVNRQFRLMRPLCSELILVTDEPKLFLTVLDEDVRMITDFHAGIGALGGLHAALSLSGNEQVWAVACDMPHLSAEAAKLMLDRQIRHRLDAVLPSIGDRLYPYHGIFDRGRAGLISELAAAGQTSVHAYLDRIRCDKLMEWNFRRRGIDPLFVMRMDSKRAYEEALSSPIGNPTV